MIYLWREKAAFLTGDVSRKGWLFVGLLSVLPVAVAVGNTRLSPTGIGRLWCVVSSLLVFLGSALLLLNLPWSPWLFTRTRDVHMVPAALLAAAFGLALATLVFWLRRREWFSNMSWPRGPEWVAALLLALALLPAGALTYYRVHTRLARLLHYVTHGMLHALGERQWLVTEGVLDTLLQVGACERGQTLYLLNGPQSAYRPYRRMLQKRFPHEPRQRGLALYSPRGLLREWLQEDPEVTGKLAVEQSHSLWRDNGFAAVPVCGLYLGFRPDPGEVDAVGLFEQQKVFWSGLVELLEHAPAAYHPEEKELRRRVLAHVSKLANEFGLVLEAEKQPVLAAECYGLARRIDPDNLMAFLNQYQLRVDAGDPDVDEIWRQVRRETFKAGAAVPVQMLLLRYGPVRNTELAIRYRRLYEPQEPPAPPAAAEAGMAQVRAARREGRSADAMRLAQEVIKSYDMPEAWVVLGLLAYDAGDLPLFERCFQHMQSLNQFWPDLLVVAGREAFRKKDWRLARRHFDAACNVQPTNHVALEYLIRIALITQDTRRVVPPLDQLLAIDPGNATANYAMAYLHFVQGEYGLAEMTLDKSLEYRADATAIANLAWLLQVQGKEDVALKYARQAVKLDAGLAPAWDILASVLLAQGDLTGAEEAINEALRIEPNIIEIQFNQMRILARSGRGAQVREMAERLDKSGIPFTPEQRRELERHLAPAPP
jgi:tetratricopeptide (TPR) repeat protein